MAVSTFVYVYKVLISSLEIAGTRAANSGSVDGVVDNVPRSAKYGTCPPHLLKRTAAEEAYGENVASREEEGSAKK